VGRPLGLSEEATNQIDREANRDSDQHAYHPVAEAGQDSGEGACAKQGST
jgi:hypothetical protein